MVCFDQILIHFTPLQVWSVSKMTEQNQKKLIENKVFLF